MGAINNAFNQALGAAAGAGLAIKHAKESDFSKMNTAEHAALVANNQAVEAETAAKDAQLDEDINSRAWGDAVFEQWNKEDEYNKVKDDKNVSYKTKMKKLTELDAAKRAFKEIDNKVQGLEDMRQRAKDQRAYADKASKIASKAQQKYQSRWGIK